MAIAVRQSGFPLKGNPITRSWPQSAGWSIVQPLVPVNLVSFVRAHTYRKAEKVAFITGINPGAFSRVSRTRPPSHSYPPSGLVDELVSSMYYRIRNGIEK